MSAIDWLSDSIAARPAPAAMPEAPARPGGVPDQISVVPLDAPNPDASGLVGAAQAGIAAGFWGITPTAEVGARLGAVPVDGLPAGLDLLYRILLAEVAPPIDSDGTGRLFLARVDKLLDLGAVDQATALLEREGTRAPENFRRWFDGALLLGNEDRACSEMRANPAVAPAFAARVYCLARGGDWNTAMLTLHTAQALGFVSPEDDALISRFLDPELSDGAEPLPPPSRPSPLVWRMMEAIGEPLPSSSLPVAFAQADMRENTGWKTRIEAGERLARTRALPPNALLGLYSERRAAASGGVWERVKAMQALDAAMSEAEAGRTGPLSTALPAAWSRMAEVELEVALAELYGERLMKLPLDGVAGAMAFRVALLSPAYQQAATARQPSDLSETFLKALAGGNLRGITPPDRLAGAIRDGFRRDALPADVQAMIADNRSGEVVLIALVQLAEGAQGNLRSLSQSLAALRAAGFEDTARRAGLQLLLLDRRG